MRFETDRLSFRDFRLDDIDAVAALFSEKSSHKHLLRRQRNADHILEFARYTAQYAAHVKWSKRESLHFIVTLRNSETIIGTCNLSNAYESSNDAYIGWHFSEKFAGLGYATEAARELLRIAFVERGVQRVTADCFRSNQKSVRIFQKLGMRPSPRMYIWFALKYLELRPIVRYYMNSMPIERAK